MPSRITEIDTRAQVWTYAGGYKRANDLAHRRCQGRYRAEPHRSRRAEDKDNADRAVFVKMEGWDVPLELRVVAQVSPTEASCVVAGVGTLKAGRGPRAHALDPRHHPRRRRRQLRGDRGAASTRTASRCWKADGKPIFVTVNRPTKVLDLINQRPLIEGEIERRIRPEALKSCVTIREVRLGEPAIPPELLVAVRREQLATQLAKAFIQEKGAQEKRIESDKAKATADQQSDLVRAEIAVQTSVQNAQALRNQGQGERDRLTFISEGQRAQTEVLGADATVKLRQYELILDRVFGFVDKNPNVLAVALANAHKFVPERVTNIGGGGGSGGAICSLALRPSSATCSIPGRRARVRQCRPHPQHRRARRNSVRDLALSESHAPPAGRRADQGFRARRARTGRNASAHWRAQTTARHRTPE